MKDVFASRCVSEFNTLLVDFAESLDESLKSDDVKEWVAYVRASDAEQLIEAWYATIVTQMGRAHAKYVRAVADITDQPVVVYHAIRYKDATAIDACQSPLKGVKCAKCVHGLSDSDTVLFWKFMCELSDTCYRWKQTPTPPVPTTAEIAENMQHRRAQRDAPSPPVNTVSDVRGLNQGVDDLWSQLCTKRNVTVPITEAIRERIRECVRVEVTGPILNASFPDLGNDTYTAEQIAIVDRMKNLVTMDDAIPSDMMRGIEAVASRIVKDINNGRCDLASLDIESIGQQVISGVNEEDMSKFASNLDKIIPALQRAHQE